MSGENFTLLKEFEDRVILGDETGHEFLILKTWIEKIKDKIQQPVYVAVPEIYFEPQVVMTGGGLAEDLFRSVRLDDRFLELHEIELNGYKVVAAFDTVYSQWFVLKEASNE
jgi:hypothetical protein